MTIEGGRLRRWLPCVASVAVLVAVVVCALFEILTAPPDRLPGTDAGIHYAWEVYARSILNSGRLPHWNPYQYSGMPHLANSQVMVLYPPAMMLRWLPPETFLPFLAALHLVIGGAGALFLGRVLGIGWMASVAAAVAVAVGGSVGPWLFLGHLVIVNGVAWLPWALGAAILTVRRRTLLPHPVLPLVLLLQVLSGYAQGGIYITAVVAFYFVFSAVWPDRAGGRIERWRPIAQLAVLGVLTAGLTAFQVLPLVTLASEAARTAGLSFEDAVEGGWTLRDLTSFFRPDSHASDRAAYVGVLLTCIVPLALFDRARRRIVVFFAVLILGAVGLAFADDLPFYRLHHQLFPGFRIPGRALFVATVSLAILGAIGTSWLVAAVTSRRSRLAPAMIVLAVMAVISLLATAWAPLMDESSRSYAALWRPLLAIVGLAGIVAGGSRLGPRPAFVVAAAIVAIELTTFTAAAVQTVPLDSPSTIRGWLGAPDGGRAITLCEQRVGWTGLSLAERPSLAGPLGMNLRDYVDWLNIAYSGDRPSDALGGSPVRRDLLDMSNVSTVVGCEHIDAPLLTLVTDADPVRVYRNDGAWPRAIWTCAARPMSRTDAMVQLRLGRYASTGLLLRDAIVSVRWSPDVEDGSRVQLESRYGLTEGVHRDGSTWRYVLRDVGAANVVALVRDPLVEDTHGVDRQTGAVVDAMAREVGTAAAGSEFVVGTSPCGDRGTVEVLLRDQPDGRVVATVEAPVAGFVFFSEPYYPERVAFVNGERVEAIKANLAFTAVSVPAGRHEIELRMVPVSFYAGVAVSLLAVTAWAGAVLIPRRRVRHDVDAHAADASTVR